MTVQWLEYKLHKDAGSLRRRKTTPGSRFVLVLLQTDGFWPLGAAISQHLNHQAFCSRLSFNVRHVLSCSQVCINIWWQTSEVFPSNLQSAKFRQAWCSCRTQCLKDETAIGSPLSYETNIPASRSCHLCVAPMPQVGQILVADVLATTSNLLFCHMHLVVL